MGLVQFKIMLFKDQLYLNFVGQSVKSQKLMQNISRSSFSFLDTSPQARVTKNEQVGLHQTQELLHSKGHHQPDQEASHSMGEYICKQLI